MRLVNPLPDAQVAVALSGGVDSAVAAALLKAQGLRVLGVHLRLAARGPAEEHLQALARRLDIPLIELDMREDFGNRVLAYFAREYSRGRTPNPCVRCNAAIKFGRVWQLLREAGIPRLATGHYARLLPGADGMPELHRARDRAKDQSYFLQRLDREVLPHLLFPLGELTKPEVRARARDLELPLAEDYRESQELCFIPQGPYQDFLRQMPGVSAAPGDLVDSAGRVLGRHRGVAYYTVGQRRGLGVPAAAPYYVVEIQPASNRVVLGYQEELLSAGLRASGVNWLIPGPTAAMTARAMIRYRHPGVAARVFLEGPAGVRVIFDTPQTAVAPGQAVAFYLEDRLLGGGWIEERIK